MADNQELEPILLHEDTHQKDLISLLGTQGLMYNDYNAAEYKLLMLIIKHNQTVITGTSPSPKNNSRQDTSMSSCPSRSSDTTDPTISGSKTSSARWQRSPSTFPTR